MKRNIGIVGYGYWGPNLARNFASHPECVVRRIAEVDPNQRAKAKLAWPHSEVVTHADQILTAPDIDIAVIATPVSTHFELTMTALRHGKHVWVEKPVAATSDEARRIADEADKRRLTVITDHTFLFTGPVIKMKEIIQSGEMGSLLYYDSVRVNLGMFQHDVNVLWDLATHDLAIINYLVEDRPTTVSAIGSSHFNGHIDVGYLTLWYQDNFIAHFHANWLSPVKIRRTLVGGDQRMLVWDDGEREEKIKVYDKGVKVFNREGVYQMLATYRVGDMRSPLLSTGEALAREVGYFIDCIDHGRSPHNDALAGMRVVEILEAADRSLALNGAPVELP